MIPYGRQSVDENDIKAVVDVLKSDFLTTGPKVYEFEKNFALVVGAKYAVAVSNGTAALHLACLVAGLKQGNELITTPMTFAASANCAFYCNAKPVFVDIKENGLIDENKVEEKITDNTKVIVPVHYTGLSCNMEEIKKIAEKHKLLVIEDACHALGGKYKDSKIGACKYSDMAVFSFHPVKHITTGEGGMITTNSKELYEKLLILRNHGITRDKDKFTNKEEGDWFYEMQELGFNYRMNDIQCALGINQLKKLNAFVGKRREIAKRYDDAFKDFEEIDIIGDDSNAYHLYVIKVKDSRTRLALFNNLKKKGILCQVHYIPVYLHPYYKKQGYKKGLCPNAELFYSKIISIPMHPTLNKDEQEKVIKEIGDFFGK